MGRERDRVLGFNTDASDLASVTPWYLWGPYVSDRAWGTVREQYSDDPAVSPWECLPHDEARSRAYRWNEDGLAGVCDIHQRLCLALALWNGRDRILKERLFGLTGNEGNHGEDVKEYYWHLDALPSHAWLRWRYHYPQAEFPYRWLVEENRRRRDRENRGGPEAELLDSGVFDDDRYWIVEVSYAKADPTDLLARIVVRNAGPDPDTLHVLPTLWFRNTWSWEVGAQRPALSAHEDTILAEHPGLGRYRLLAGAGPAGSRPTLLFCENDTNVARLFPPATSPTAYPKDGINDHVVRGSATVNPAGMGTKAAAWYRLPVPPGGSVELRLRLRIEDDDANPDVGDPLGDGFTQTIASRQAEADEFFAEFAPPGSSADEKRVIRQACAGMVWSKKFYHYNVARWLDGDVPAQPRPPATRTGVNNAGWRHLNAADVLALPDPWEYPWFAAWDLAFHTVVFAHIDPAFAKHQLELLCREWYQHPAGALPAFEWGFDNANPPVHAWAALKVWRLDGKRDDAFLRRVFLKLLLNFTWWVNRKDADGNNLFEGGFLGLDNISVFDRSSLPVPGTLEQSDATGWMAFYCLSMLQIARQLAARDPAYEQLVTKFLEHFARLSMAIDDVGLWDETDQFFYDRLRTDHELVSLRVHSLVGVVPLLATALVDEEQAERVNALGKAFSELMSRRRAERDPLREPVFGTGRLIGLPQERKSLVSMVGGQQLAGMLGRYLLDEAKFLSPYGVRSLSAEYRGQPYVVEVAGVRGSIDYQPAESTDPSFGGNSNWRGPVWWPLNYLLVDRLAEFGEHLRDTFTVEYPAGSGEWRTLLDVAADLRRRLIALFLRGDDGRRPCHGWVDRLQSDPEWCDNILFFEYFHGDNGAGLGASHQTGWNALVADLLCATRGVVLPAGEQ